MELQVDSKVIPNQSLEGKICKVSRIIDIFACNEYGERNRFGKIAKAQRVAVRIKNVSDTVEDEFYQFLTKLQFTDFRSGYLNQDTNYLIGKPVLSVYDNDSIGFLRGLIPLPF